MSTDLDARGGQPPHLTPPPRVSPPPRASRPAPLADGAAGGAAKWLTAALFGVLAVAAIAVFVVLPDWVHDRAQADVAPAGAVAAASVTPEVDAEAAEPEPLTPTGSSESNDDTEREAEATATPAPQPTAPRPPQPSPPPPSAAAQGDGGFARAMTKGLAALERRDYAAAREEFARAAVIRPGSPQSADGLARAEAGARLAAITALSAEARDLEAREDWHAARERYQAILEIDAAVELAIDGLAHSRRRAELADRLEEHLAKPERLASDEVLEEAAAVLELTSAIEAPGPKLARQSEQLTRLVEVYSTPITATLESDQLTEVVVYKVGRLGTFQRHDLDLRPGTYTVVGSRRGYRDVRHQLVIEPGVAPRPLAIRCEERI